MRTILLNLTAVVLVVLSGVLLSYDHITAFGLNLGIPQGLSLSVVGFTALLAAVDAFVQGTGQNYQSDQAAQERDRADRERALAAEERERAARERDRAAEERERAARRAQLQNRFLVLQIRHQLEGSDATRSALRDFLALLEEYGE